MHSALYYFPNHDVGSITNISGAAVLASEHPQARAERFVTFLVSTAGAGDHRPRRRLRVPRPARHRRQPRAPAAFARSPTRRSASPSSETISRPRG